MKDFVVIFSKNNRDFVRFGDFFDRESLAWRARGENKGVNMVAFREEGIKNWGFGLDTESKLFVSEENE